jgi:glycosyltransferase involved in cell wall biosynthesis
MLRVVHAIHDFLPAHRAGSELYAFELARELARHHDAWVLCAEYDPRRPHLSLTWREYDGVPVVELVNRWAFRSFEETYRSPAINERLRHVLHALQPDVVHVHNLLNLSVDLPALARARGIPVVATLHDYTLLCPSGGQRVHVSAAHVCWTIDPARCSRCFRESPFYAQTGFGRLGQGRLARFAAAALRGVRRRAPGWFGRLAGAARRAPALAVTPAAIERRLAFASRVFDTVDLFVSPSAALAAEFVRAGLRPEKLQVSDYGIRRFEPVRRARQDDRLRIGFVGTLVWHKGAHVLVEAVTHLPRDRVELCLFGDPTVFPAYTASLRARAAGWPVRFMGPFEPAARASVYGGIDVLAVPSIWPENSPLVIHEAWLAGVPVVASRVGGIPELVTHEVNGLLVEPSSPTALAGALKRLLDEPDRLARYREGIPPVKRIEDDAREWEARYREVVDRARSGRTGEARPA